MDEKTELPLPEANLTIDDRAQELEGRIKIQQEILMDLRKKGETLEPNAKQLVGETKKASAKAAMAFTDLDWVEALQAANLTDEQILKIWKIKDEQSAQERDRKNQESVA